MRKAQSYLEGALSRAQTLLSNPLQTTAVKALGFTAPMQLKDNIACYKALMYDHIQEKGRYFQFQLGQKNRLLCYSYIHVTLHVC